MTQQTETSEKAEGRTKLGDYVRFFNIYTMRL